MKDKKSARHYIDQDFLPAGTAGSGHRGVAPRHVTFSDLSLVEVRPHAPTDLSLVEVRPHAPPMHPLVEVRPHAPSEKDLLSWCDEDPAKRYPMAASVVQTFSRAGDPEQFEWKPVVYSLLQKAPNVTELLENIAGSLYPSSWSGSLADALQRRVVMLEKLFDHENTEIGSWARSQYRTLQEGIKVERECEESRNRYRNESFE